MARTILMIHGYGCAGDAWDTAAKRLRAEGYRVETPTLRAEQRKTAAPGAGLATLSLADYVADMSALAAALAKQDGEAPIVFGHSMGGMIAQKLAEADLVSAAVLFAPASSADARGAPKLSPVFTFLNVVMTPRPETKAVKMWKTGFKWGVLNAVPASRHDALYAKAVYDSGRALADLAWPDKDPNRTVTVDAEKVRAPILVVAGALDRTTPVGDLRLVGAKYGSDYVEYPNNAHWLIDEPGSDIILDDVVAWLKNKDLTAAPVAAAKPAASKPAAQPAAKPPAPAVVEKAVAQKAAAAPAKVVAETSPAPAPKAASKTAAPKPKVAPVATEKAPAKAKTAPKTTAPKAAAPVAEPASKARPVAKAAPAAAPKVAASKPKTAAPKPVATKPAAPKAAAPKAAVPKAAASKAATKPAATPSPAKSSPKPKKSV